MHRRSPVIIDRPEQRILIRRCLIACAVLTAFAYAAACALYLRGVDQLVRVGVVAVMVCAVLAIKLFLAKRLELSRHTHASLPYPLDLALLLVAALAGAAFFIAIPAEPHHPVPAWAALIGGPPLVAGVVLLLHAFRATAPAPPACPACNYELAGLNLPTSCPECARPLTRADAATPRFTRVRRPPLAWTGAGLAAFAALWIFLITNATDQIYRSLPAPLLRALAPTERPAFEAINTDTLTPAQRVALAEGIIDAMRTHDQWLMSVQIAWISEQIAAGRLPPETVDRFAGGNFNLRIIHRAVPRSAAIEFSIIADPPLTDPVYITHRYFFAGFEFNAGPLFNRGGDSRVTLSLQDGWPIIDAHHAELSYSARPMNYRPTATYLPSPGPLTVRARIVTVLTRAPNTPTIMWTAGDQYILTGDVIHTAELTAEITLEIDP